MALGPLVPEFGGGVAVLTAALLGILAFAAWLVCSGTLYAWEHTFGALIRAIVGLASFKLPVVGRVNLAWPLDALDNAVQHALSVGVRDSEIAMGKFFHAAGVIVGWMANFALATATTMEHAFGWLIHQGIPKLAKNLVYVAYPPAFLYKLIASRLAHLLPHVGRVVKVVAHDATTVIYRPVKAFERRLTHDEALLHRLYAHVVHAVGGIALPLPVDTPAVNWRGFTRRLSRIERRLHRAEGWLAAGALALAIGNVLGVSARCLRSGNIGRTARRLCGLDRLLMDALLADLGFMAGTVSIVEFAKALQRAEPLIATSLTYLVDDLGLARDEVEQLAKRSLAIVESLA